MARVPYASMIFHDRAQGEKSTLGPPVWPSSSWARISARLLCFFNFRASGTAYASFPCPKNAKQLVIGSAAVRVLFFFFPLPSSALFLICPPFFYRTSVPK
jgi:hypothetical protein